MKLYGLKLKLAYWINIMCLGIIVGLYIVINMLCVTYYGIILLGYGNYLRYNNYKVMIILQILSIFGILITIRELNKNNYTIKNSMNVYEAYKLTL